MNASNQSKRYSKTIINKLSRILYTFFPTKKRLENLIIKGNDYRPHYGYNILKTFEEAERLGIEKFSIIEFGCAGGSGLIDIEYHVERLQKYFKIEVDVYGFDAGDGLPESTDYRDVLYLWKQGDYKMQKDSLTQIIQKSKIIIGDVKDTFPKFISSMNYAPIGLVFQDMDYYSSTINSLNQFGIIDNKKIFPRARFYFDDTLYTSKFLGELLAIEEFNEQHNERKLSLIELEAEFLSMNWSKWIYLGKKFYFLHSFSHPQYNANFKSKNLKIG